MSAARARPVLAVALAAAAAGCPRPDPVRRAAPDAAPRPRAAAVDAGPATAAQADAARPAPPPYQGPTGTVEGVVILDGPIRREPPIPVSPAWRDRPGCRDAARRYSQPFDVTTPGPFPGALVTVYPEDQSAAPPEDRRLVFRDCDIVPRVLFMRPTDRLILHADTRISHLPHIDGSGAVIDQLLIPGQPDRERNLPPTAPARYPVTARDLPSFVRSLVYVLPQRHVDQTDVQGRFRITGVPVGNRTVYAFYPGTIEARQVVAVRPDETARVELHLRQSPPPPPRPPAPPEDAGEIPP